MISAIVVLVICGALVAVQTTANAALARSIGLPVFVFVFSLVQLLTTLPFLYSARSRFSALSQVPPWQYVGALVGGIILVGVAFSVARVGTFAALVTWLVGQLSMAMLIDQYGWLGAPTLAITLPRVLGLCLVVAGVFLARL